MKHLQHSNPAEKLLNIFDDLITTYHMYGNAASFEIFSAVFKSSPIQTVSYLMNVLKLIETAEQMIQNDTNIINKTIYLSPFLPLKNILAPIPINMNQHFSDCLSVISSCRSTLEFCSEAFKKTFTEKPIDEETLKQLLSEGNTLFDNIKSKLPDGNLKKLLLKLLQSHNESIQSYRIRGAESIDESINYIIGTLSKYKESIKGDISTLEVEESSLLDEVEVFFRKITTTLNSAQSYIPLIETTYNFFKRIDT